MQSSLLNPATFAILCNLFSGKINAEYRFILTVSPFYFVVLFLLFILRPVYSANHCHFFFFFLLTSRTLTMVIIINMLTLMINARMFGSVDCKSSIINDSDTNTNNSSCKNNNDIEDTSKSLILQRCNTGAIRA